MNPFCWILFHCKDRMSRRTRPFERHLVGSNLIGAEVGVFRGFHARTIYRTGKVRKLYLIDPYSVYMERGVKLDTQNRLGDAWNLLKNYQVEFILARSTAVTELEPLNFVYIDEDHNYEAVKADLEHWWPRIVEGGVMGGHDYDSEWPGVCRAVNEFCEANRLKLSTQKSDWWINK